MTHTPCSLASHISYFLSFFLCCICSISFTCSGFLSLIFRVTVYSFDLCVQGKHRDFPEIHVYVIFYVHQSVSIHCYCVFYISYFPSILYLLSISPLLTLLQSFSLPLLSLPHHILTFYPFIFSLFLPFSLFLFQHLNTEFSINLSFIKPKVLPLDECI